jgi:Flp pilus assembly protein TadD
MRRGLAGWLLACWPLLAGQTPLEQAVEHIRAGRLNEAETLLLTVNRDSPGAERADFLLGSVQFSTGRLEAALQSFERYTTAQPSDGAGWRMLGAVYAARGDHRSAGKALQSACDLAPKDPDACYYLGRNHYVLNHYDDALEAYARAFQTGHKRWRTEQGQALALEALGRTEEAEASLRRAVSRNRGEARGHEDPRIELGAFLARQGRPQEALAPLEDVLKTFPESTRAHLELGRALLQANRVEDAAGRLQRAVELEPGNWPAHLLLGKAYFRLGRTEEGERHSALGQQGLASESSSRSIR